MEMEKDEFTTNHYKMFVQHHARLVFAVMETMEHVHYHGRLHNDLHLNNMLMYFEGDHSDNPSQKLHKVSVDVCDWGRACRVEHAKSRLNQKLPTPRGNVKANHIKYTQLVP